MAHADEWRRVKPFRGVDQARVRYLTFADAARLINACDLEFRPLVEAALHTGARYGQITRLIVADFNAAGGTLRLSTRKGDGSVKVYHVVLTAEGIAFFKRACVGRARDAVLFVKAEGGEWDKSQQSRPMAEACTRAKIKPAASFHVLRHTWASHAVMNGVPLLVVAKNLGHSDTRMVERHYGHLAASYVADVIRSAAPRFGSPSPDNLAALDDRR